MPTNEIARTIEVLGDLSGKRIGGTSDRHRSNLRPTFFSTLNIDAVFSYGTWNELVAQLERGEIDGLAVAGSVPFPAILGLEGKASDQVYRAYVGGDRQAAVHVSAANRHGNSAGHLFVVVGALSDHWLLQFRGRR